MAELVDALDSKSGYRKVVQVRFLFWAQTLSRKWRGFLMRVANQACLNEHTSIKKPNEMRSILLKGFGYAPRRSQGRRRNEMKPAVLFTLNQVLSKAKNGSPVGLGKPLAEV